MPTYEYHCDSCDENFDVVQSFHDDPITACPTCGSPVRKVFGNVGIVFKGSGFYKTDSRAGSAKKSSSADGTASTAGGSESTGSDAGSGGDSGTSGGGEGASTTPSAPSTTTTAPSTTPSKGSDNGKPTTPKKAPA